MNAPQVTLSPAVAKGRYGLAVRHFGVGSIEADKAKVDLTEANIAQLIKNQRAKLGAPLPKDAQRRIIAVLDGGSISAGRCLDN